MFAKHLPPGALRVMALDDASAAELPPEIEVVRGDAAPAEVFDAIVGHSAPDGLAGLLTRLRPGGRVILAQRSGSQQARSLLEALIHAGFIHCFVEPASDVVLYRGERPPLGSPIERVQALAADFQPHPIPHFVFLLITQTPNKPAWRPLAVAPDEVLEWRAATIVDPATGQPVLLAFSSLVKAVAFMQPAILARFMEGINKVGKFRAQVAQTWGLPLRLNPDFDDVRSMALGPPFDVDARTAITGEE
jgi:hypothetical protein